MKKQQNMEPKIIYEDDDVLVIDKPAGLIVHSDGRTEEPSVAGWVLETHPYMSEAGEPWVSPQGEIVPRPGIVHRLDRTTSGVMALAKNKKAYEFLKLQFQSRSIEKTYRAFVYGHPKEDSGTIEKEIVRIRSNPPRWGVKRFGEEKKHRAAVTEWRMRVRGEDFATGEKVSYIELSPKTGRTHQLRVHMKAINHPVVCDSLYAPRMPCLLNFSRPALHAYRLSVALPSGEHRVFEAPLPEDFVSAEERMISRLR